MLLESIENQLSHLLADMNLRTTLERAERIGFLLNEARPKMQHGQWVKWLKRLKINRKTASDYVLAYKGLANQNVRPVGQIGLRAFLEALRDGKRAEIDARRAKAREAAAGIIGDLPDNIQLFNEDCRKFRWPSSIDIITADPPWDDMDILKWLGDFASSNLKAGGLLLVQTSNHNLASALAILQKRLKYVWTLAVVYHHANSNNAAGRFRSCWKPILVLSKGKPRLKESLSDTYTVHRGDKRFHRWQQPAQAWQYWLSRLAAPDSLVAEPFVGCGTIPLVCNALGLKFVGTEVDEGTFQIARGRLAGKVEA